VTLDREDIDALAVRVAELLEQRQARSTVPLVDAAEIARRFGTDRAWVYSHADELGAVKLGTGPKARLRFDPQIVLERVENRSKSEGRKSTRKRAKSKRSRNRNTARLLPIKGSGIS